MSKKVQTKSIKSYILLFSLVVILLLIVYEDRIPDFSDYAINTMNELLSGSDQTSRLPGTQIEAAPTPIAKAGGRKADNVLRILHPEAPTILNPYLTNSVKDLEASRITYEPLASFDKDGQLILFLAAEAPKVAADGKSVTWQLKQDIKWSDGQPFTAEDVRFTYQFATNPKVQSNSANLYSTIEDVQVIDPYTVKVNFKDVNPAWYVPFVGLRGAILPRHIFEPYNGDNARKASANTLPVGTGPYRVVEPGIKPQEVLLLGTQTVETKKIVYTLNPHFREADKVFFSQVELRGGGTVKEAARLVLQEGKVDYAYNLGQLSPEELANMEETGQGRLVVNFGSWVERILLNRTDPNQETEDGERSSLKFSHPFFSNKKIRQAFAHAIDREAIAALYGQIGRPTYNNLIIPPHHRYDSMPATFYAFDLEKSKVLLDETGWIDTDNDGIRDKDGINMKVFIFQMLTTTPKQYGQIVKKALESIGIEVELKLRAPTIMFSPGADNPDSVRRFNADMQEFQRMAASLDPVAYLQFWTCDQIPQKNNNWSGYNYERWCNKDFEKQLQQAAIELNPEKRRQLVSQMNDMMIEDVVMIPVVYVAESQGVGRDIEGVDLTPWDANTWNIKDWRRISPEERNYE